MHHITKILFAFATFCIFASQLAAQTITIGTVERPPFSIGTTDHRGFSIELMKLIGAQIGQEVVFESNETFGGMLDSVTEGQVDGAIANISITAAREEIMDFSQPIFESGIQIMVRETTQTTFWKQLLTWELVAFLLSAAAILFCFGMIMWVVERRRQPYFERSFDEALFPSFWWALNLVVNGGFEERMPRSVIGRLLAVFMVVSSLFVVSLFVARVTAVMTVNALSTNVTGLKDLDSRSVGTVSGSTSARFLESRDFRYFGYMGFAELMAAYEGREIDTVVFDGPLLKYYLLRNSQTDTLLLDRVFRAEDYGIALQSDSPLREPINQAILTLRESGAYDRLLDQWFQSR